MYLLLADCKTILHILSLLVENAVLNWKNTSTYFTQSITLIWDHSIMCRKNGDYFYMSVWYALYIRQISDSNFTCIVTKLSGNAICNIYSKNVAGKIYKRTCILAIFHDAGSPISYVYTLSYFWRGGYKVNMSIYLGPDSVHVYCLEKNKQE